MTDLRGAFRDHLIQIFHATDGEIEVLKITCSKAHVMLKSETRLESLYPDNQISVVTIRKLLRFDGLKTSPRRGNNSDLSLGQISEAQLWLQCQCHVRHGLGWHTCLFVMSEPRFSRWPTEIKCILPEPISEATFLPSKNWGKSDHFLLSAVKHRVMEAQKDKGP